MYYFVIHKGYPKFNFDYRGHLHQRELDNKIQFQIHNHKILLLLCNVEENNSFYPLDEIHQNHLASYRPKTSVTRFRQIYTLELG